MSGLDVVAEALGRIMADDGSESCRCSGPDHNGDRAVRTDRGDYVLYADGSWDRVDGWGPEWPPPVPGEDHLTEGDTE